jgi:hypothetical protein
MATNDENVGVRLKIEEEELLRKICRERGEQLSDFIRRSIKKELVSLNYYPKETRKALGISEGGESQ